MAVTVEPSDFVLTLPRVKVEPDANGHAIAEVEVRLWGGESEADAPLSVSISCEKQEWENGFDLTPGQIRALHSFLGFVLGEIRARGDAAPRGDAARSEPPV